MRIVLAQINPTVGDVKGNLAMCVDAVTKARDAKADVVVFPELVLSGYPPEDLLFRRDFMSSCRAASEALADRAKDIVIIFGTPWCDEEDKLRNAAVVASKREIAGLYFKRHLPTYGVFDEDRYFESGPSGSGVFETDSGTIGVSVCEDLWIDDGELQAQAKNGATVLINISASPFDARKQAQRETLMSARAKDAGAWLVYTNLVGGQDEVVFDGGSTVWTPDGHLFKSAKDFESDFLVVDVGQGADETHSREGRRTFSADIADEVDDIYKAIRLGVHDYVTKNGFSNVVIGLSGGIDSSLVATIAADALGPNNVTGLILPSRYSSDHSREDASALAANLGIEVIEISIEDPHKAFEAILDPHISGQPHEEQARENIQARIRGTTWMAHANATGALALCCGNKSEFALGYATLYGDMAGALAPLKDVPKTLVYEIAKLRRDMIPERVFTKVPSAELRPNQTDEETLGSYEVIDDIVMLYVEESLSVSEIVASGIDEATTKRIVHMIDKAEFKRRQAPPGIKITTKAFGRDRRMPMTNRFE